MLQNVEIQHPTVAVPEVLTLENLTFRRGIINVKRLRTRTPDHKAPKNQKKLQFHGLAKSLSAYNASAKRTPAWLVPLLFTSCLRLDSVEREIEGNVEPGTPTAHTRAPSRLLEETVHF
jgi:hypothetical protein